MDSVPRQTLGNEKTPLGDPPGYNAEIEDEWQQTLRRLQASHACLSEARKKRTERRAQASNEEVEDIELEQRIRVLEELIIADTLQLARIHPDPSVKEEWKGRAKQFKETLANPGATQAEKESALAAIGKGIGILLITPFALVAGVVYAAGAILYGAGKAVFGLGQLLTFGTFKF